MWSNEPAKSSPLQSEKDLKLYLCLKVKVIQPMQTCTTTYVCKTTAGWCIIEKKTPLYIISAVTLRLFNAPLALPGTVNKLLRGKAPTSVSSECTSGLEWTVPKLYLMTYNHNILDSRSSSPLYNNFGIFSLCFFSYILIEYKIL